MDYSQSSEDQTVANHYLDFALKARDHCGRSAGRGDQLRDFQIIIEKPHIKGLPKVL